MPSSSPSFAVVVGTVLVMTMSIAGVRAWSEVAEADRVVDLPGTEALPEAAGIESFSGYLNLGAQGQPQKNVHYWLVLAETAGAEQNSLDLPLTMWTNGGPGCSGMIGFFMEHGPFMVNDDAATLSMNPSRWTQVSNMLYLESPVGVGFSYSDDTDDYRTGDAQVAQDNYDTLQAFMDRFPEFRSKELYVASESYGGHYLPTLANLIVQQQQQQQEQQQQQQQPAHTANVNESRPRLNFKGFAVGNAYTQPRTNNYGEWFTYWGRGMVSRELWMRYDDKCASLPDQLYERKECMALEVLIAEQVNTDLVSPYALSSPVCNAATLQHSSSSSSTIAGTGQSRRMARLAVQSDEVRAALFGPSNSDAATGYERDEDEHEICGDVYTTRYLNVDAVKDAIHVRNDIKFKECASLAKIPYEEKDQLVDMVPFYRTLLEADNALKILVYSGDDDVVCSTWGTQAWLEDDLGYDKAKNWKPWLLNGQIAGYATVYDVPFTNQFAFFTVHGAGHEVPLFKPGAALDMFTSFLDGSAFHTV